MFARPCMTESSTLPSIATSVAVAIYVRRSTDDEHQPYSLESQLTRLRAYIASQPGWVLVDTFRDDASQPARPTGGAVRSAVQTVRPASRVPAGPVHPSHPRPGSTHRGT